MYYINQSPNESGNYGNPQSRPFEGAVALPDELLGDYIGSMGFVELTTEGGTVTALRRNEEAYNAYAEAHPVTPDPEPTPAEQREEAYNTEPIIPWDGDMITVTAAALKWQYYAAEGSSRADELTELIAAAKAAIRERYPD